MTPEPYLRRWSLLRDGPPINTHSSCLLPVRQGIIPAMLKLSHAEEESRGSRLMVWWNGEGAARVLEHEDDALLIERATGPDSLAAMAHQGQDDTACLILCATAMRPHAPRKAPPPPLVPLSRWFEALEPAARSHGGILRRCATAAQELQSSPQAPVVLHGDLHHGNVLDFGAHGWLAIDPKALLGERGFDFANIFLNPDLADPTHPVAADPTRFIRRLGLICTAAALERGRMLHWILAWSGLSMAWLLADGQPVPIHRQIAELAAAELDR